MAYVSSGGSMRTYYDYVLWSIPTILLGAWGLLSAIGVPSRIGLAIGALLAAGPMAHALFVNAPVPSGDGRNERGSTSYPGSTAD
jgi:hypothetical protein